jgi:hypothetical protein
MIKKILKPGREFVFWESDEEFYRLGAKALRSNCILESSKLLKAGVNMRTVEDALRDSIREWEKV